MKHLYSVVILLYFLVCGVVGPLEANAQKRNRWWYFGNQAGLDFNSGAPVAVSNGQMNSYEGCASIATPSGSLVMYTDGDLVWDATHQVMPNGRSLGSHNSASQAALILPHPGNPAQYFIFSVDAIDNNLVGGLRYSVVDMSLRGGLGDVVAGSKAVRLATPTLTSKVTEKLTAALHANGQDYWVVVHGWNNNEFYSFRLSAAGISPSPVISRVGPIHQGGGSFFGAANAVGYMRISPLGTHLALAQRDTQFELYNFNNATGFLSNYIPLSGTSDYYYGVEFSPDNSRLYTSMYSNGGYSSYIYQYNLLAGSSAAITNSQQTIATISGLAVPLQLGPDGKIYVSVLNRNVLHAVNNPNALGLASDFRLNAVSLGQKVGQNGLPNMPNAYATTVLPLTAAFTSNTVCFGTATPFAATIGGGSGVAVATWNFGDATSGTANTATGLTPTHTFSAPGTYTVTLSVTEPGMAAPITVSSTVTVSPVPTVNLGPSVQQVCQGQPVTLTAGSQPTGTTFRWQDGSTNASFTAITSGQYYVDVTNAQGCTTRGSATVQVVAPPVLTLGPALQRLCQGQTLTLSAGVQPAGATYRWQDGSTGATFVVRTSGTYSVVVTLPPGCTAQASTQVEAVPLPTVNLGQDTTLCLQQPLVLTVGHQPVGSTYRWQDGSTAATYSATVGGTYSVEVTSANGCVSRDERVVMAAECPFEIPNIITPNKDQNNETFVLKGLNPKAWSLVVYNRWGRQVYETTSYDNGWNADGHPDGVYYYMLTNATTGQLYRGWVQVAR